MCRAVWVLIAGPSADANKALRRAAGPEAQVVAMTESVAGAIEVLSSSRADVVVISAALEGAGGLVSSIRDAAPQTAIVWAGANPPDGVHASIDEVSDALESAITRGLISARKSS